MTGKRKKCPKCGKHYLVYDPVKGEAQCRNSNCDFVERVKGKLDYKTKFG